MVWYILLLLTDTATSVQDGVRPMYAARDASSLSASELEFFNSLALNILMATLWLDHDLVAIAKMLGQEDDQDFKDLVLSLVKSLLFLCNSTATLWVSMFLKRRDTVLAMALA